jgi:hypothetical protein
VHVKPAPTSAPPPPPPKDPLAAPEFTTLRELRRLFSKGGLPAERTPEAHARIATFCALTDLLRLLDEYRRRVRCGQRCRLRVHEQPSEPGKLSINITIEAEP